MRRLLNTLYITSEDSYLALDGENVIIRKGDEIAARFPLHTLEAIITFAYAGASPALMGACAERGVSLSFCTPNGRFLARAVGESNGNVYLRREQYRTADREKESVAIASSMLIGKVYNCRRNIERAIRDHGMRIDADRLKTVSNSLKGSMRKLRDAQSIEELRGLEGDAASGYYSVFDELILLDKESFYYTVRSRRPPLDNVNALLSYVYMLLAGACTNALEANGLDSFVGFMHTDRPGRHSLALDLMEELRPCLADRFVLTLINNRMIKASDFIKTESGAVMIKDDARKSLLASWQEKKREVVTHPYLGEKVSLGLVPYVQAQLLARYLRGDLEEYPPFLLK
ncbi:MAG: type I-C CRISPR-associated endonuclease Cas1 [Clostridia bacterium]|nr:type I-C CRISPR-associated endonuclease Cas1 [Clostridia bacterium]